MKRIVKILNELIDVKIRQSIHNDQAVQNAQEATVDRLNLELELALDEHIKNGSITKV